MDKIKVHLISTSISVSFKLMLQRKQNKRGVFPYFRGEKIFFIVPKRIRQINVTLKTRISQMTLPWHGFQKMIFSYGKDTKIHFQSQAWESITSIHDRWHELLKGKTPFLASWEIVWHIKNSTWPFCQLLKWFTFMAVSQFGCSHIGHM